jgi:prevent-host-death family protein
MGAGEFKAKCLAVLDEVKQTGDSVVITKRGKPVARLSSLEELLPERKSILGRLRHMGAIHGNIVASEFSDAEWARMENEPWPQQKKRPR